MSLQLHLSAQPDELLAALRPKLATARTSSQAASAGIPRPIPVLVPSAQISDWLQVRLARDLGLSMGFEFINPRAYFGRPFAGSAEAAAFADGHAFWTPERLCWRILPHVDAIAQYLGHDTAHSLGPRDRFAFAELLARQFDRYARFRPDWPEKWDGTRSVWSGDGRKVSSAALADEAWQRELWRNLAETDGALPHPTRLLERLARAKPEQTGEVIQLFVVGTDLIDPLLLRTLQVLSQRGHDVSLFLLLPSLGYLGDISRRDSWRTQLGAAASEESAETGGHPLLASLGQQAVGTFLLLDSISPDYGAWPDDVAPAVGETPTLLRRLQSDIRLQQLPAGCPTSADQSETRPEFSGNDRSLRIHCCHSPRRELEVLRDELLRAFVELPGLKPEDVLIAVTDFDAYAPLADGILRAGANPLPVRLTAIPAREANPIAVGLLALLRLSLGRRTASELVELFNLAAIQHRLQVAGEPELISQLADAIRQSGLTHGLDAANPDTGEGTGTWRAALDRHLAGAWFGPVEEVRDAAGVLVHSLAGDLYHNDDAISRLLAWLNDFAGHLCAWGEEAPASVWADRLARAIEDLLFSEIFDDHAAAVRRLLSELGGVATTTNLDAGTLLDWLQSQLENATSLRTSMGGEILLGRVDQVHGLPCRVLAILGLEDGSFPRATHRPAWDLLAHDPERWDVDFRPQDRQWFLDGVIAAQDRLILTAANRSLRTPHDGPLSSCVEELLRVAGDTVCPSKGAASLAEQIVVHHRIQPFAADYFSPDGQMPQSFDAGAARIAEDIAAAAQEEARPFLAGVTGAREDGSEETVTLAQLIAFWRDPAQAWLRALQIDVGDDEMDDTTLDDAPITLDALQAYGVRNAALGTRLPSAKVEPATVSHRLAADRALPPGALGALAWEFYDREINPLAVNLAGLLPNAKRTPVDLPAGPKVRLTGEVSVAAGGGEGPWLLTYRTSKYDSNPKYQLEAFIQTLVAAAQLNQPIGCLVLGLDDSRPKVLPPIGVEDALRQLGEIMAGYWEGQRRPLCFAPATSNALVEALAKGGDDVDALDQARTNWNQKPYQTRPGGEGTATAATLAWRDADPFSPPYDSDWLKWANAIALPLRAWWVASAAPSAPAAAKASATPKKA